MFVNTVSNPSEEERNHFDHDGFYPGIITGIEARSNSNDDYDLFVTVYVSNGYITKESKLCCPNIYSKNGKMGFKRFCRTMLNGIYEWDYEDNIEEEWNYACQNVSLTDFIQRRVDIEGYCLDDLPCGYITTDGIAPMSELSDKEIEEFDSLFEGAEIVYKLNSSQKILDYMHEVLCDDTDCSNNAFWDSIYPLPNTNQT